MSNDGEFYFPSFPERLFNFVKSWFNHLKSSLLWGLVNVLSLATMTVLFWAGPEDFIHILDSVDVFLAAAFILGPAMAAGIIDGRSRNLGMLILSGWGYMAVFLIVDGYQPDRGFGDFYIMMAVLSYPIAMLWVFCLAEIPKYFLKK